MINIYQVRLVQYICFIAVFLLFPSIGSSQLKFTWPKNPPQPERYTAVEQCIAGTSRMIWRATNEQNKEIRIDTMPLNFDGSLVSYPDSLVHFAERCSKKYDPNILSFKGPWEHAARLYIEGGQSQQLQILIKRRLDSVPAGDSVQYAAVLDTLVMLSHVSIPKDLVRADSLLKVRHNYPQTAPANAFALYYNIKQLQFARIANRADLAQSAAKRISELNEKLTAVDRSTKEFIDLRRDVQRAYDYIRWNEARSVLASNVNSYIDIRTKQWEEVTRGTVANERFPIGKVAAQIPSDKKFISPSDVNTTQLVSSSANTFPIENQLNLVVFLGHECYTGKMIGLPFGKRYGYDCPRTISALKRINTRFPELRIVVAVETHGYFSYLGPLGNDKEAELLRQWTHDYMKAPGSLVVTFLPHFFLPAPDGRRVEEILTHVTEYAFGQKEPGSGRDWIIPQTAFIVSNDGRILHNDRFVAGASMFSEQEFSDLIGAALQSAKNPSLSSATEDKVQKASSSQPPEVVEVTDAVLEKFITMIEKTVGFIDNDPKKREQVVNRLYGWLMSSSSRLAGESELEQFNDMPELKKIMATGFGENKTSILPALPRVLTALNYVETEKKSGIDQANAGEARASIKPTKAEYDAVRRHYDRISAAMNELIGNKK